MATQRAGMNESLLKMCNVQENVEERHEYQQKQQEALTTDVKALSTSLYD